MVGLWFASIKKRFFFFWCFRFSQFKVEICVIYFSISVLKQNWVFFFNLFIFFIGSSDLRWKFMSKKIAMNVKELFETDLLGGVID